MYVCVCVCVSVCVSVSVCVHWLIWRMHKCLYGCKNGQAQCSHISVIESSVHGLNCSDNRESPNTIIQT